MAAQANVLLSIKSTADLAGVKAAFDMIGAVGSKIAETMEKMDAFADAHSRLSANVSKMIESTRGLISAQDAYQASNKLSAAGIIASAEQLEGLGKKATEYAQATGQTIPDALNQMTQAVIAGSERGLKMFGVELEDGKSKLQNSQAALNQFAKEMDGFVVGVDSLSNNLEALGNNLSDAIARIVEATSVSTKMGSVFVGLNTALTDFNAMMESSNNTARTLATTLKGTLYEAMKSILEVTADIISPSGMTAEEYAKQASSGKIPGFLDMIGTILRGKARELGDASSREAYSEATREGDVTGTRNALAKAWATASKGAASAAGRRREIERGKKKKEDDGPLTPYDPYAEYDQEMQDLIGGPRPSPKYGIEDLTASETVDEMIRKAEYADSLQAKIADRVMQLQAMIRGVQEERALRSDPEVRAEMLRLEREETISFYEQSLNYAEQFENSWTSSLRNVSAASMTATAVQNGLRGAITLVANAAINGGKLTVKAVADMVKGIAMAIGIEASIKAIMELAEGIKVAASSYGADPTAELHFAAAAQYGITAGLAFAVAGGASILGGKSTDKATSLAGGTKTGSGEFGSPGYSSYGGNQGQTNVTIEITGEAGDIFRVVKKENDRRSYSGEQSFKSA